MVKLNDILAKYAQALEDNVNNKSDVLLFT